MSECVTYRGAVYPWHCDHMSHMNVMWYVGKFDEATWSLFARIGITPTRVRSEPLGMAAVDQHLTYRRELLAGDVVEVVSRILEIGEKVMRFRHEMRNAETGELAATCEIKAVPLDREARRSRPFSAETLALARAFMAPDNAR